MVPWGRVYVCIVVITPHLMKTLALSAAFALASTLAVQAQSTTTSIATKDAAKTEQAGHGCTMANAKTWDSLNLTAEQRTKVEAIQMSCEKTCSDLPKGDAKRTAAMENYDKEIKAVLTPEQLKSYKSCCAGMGEKHEEMHHDKMKHEEKGAAEPKKEKK